MAEGFNVPSGEGLLGQQQEFAANEPFKNIALAEAGLKGVMNTFMMAQQVGNKRRQLEQQLQMAYMKNDLDQREFSMKMDNAATMHAISIARLQQQSAHQNDMLEIAGKNMELKERDAALDQKKFDWSVGEKQKRIEGTEAILDVEKELAAEGITEENPNYFKEYSSRINARAAGAPASTFNKALSLAKKRVNTTSDRMLKDNIAKSNALAEDVGRTIFHDPKFQDLTPVVDFEKLPDEPPAEQSLVDRWLWNKPAPPSKPTGNKVYTYNTSAGPQKAIIPTSRLAEFNRQRNEIMEERKRIPSKVTMNYDDETVTIKDSNGRQWQIPQNQINAAKQRDPGIVIVP
jgi:hypothetical protein